MSARAGLFLVPGLLFGAGLAISGMTDPGKVTGFLDLTGDWDPSLSLVMGGAILVFSLVLYPYVYLLARAAMRDQAGQAYQAARSLGAGPAEAFPK